ncbi:hypothetical protein FACS1894193_11420 [Bacilli bacterium]|nr:hypothetical protein FACS1894192_04160 [Bacilli bacterium]GHU43878.1 hypothetical protein FACS1894193_11420 [Bacilli bacterium]
MILTLEAQENIEDIEGYINNHYSVPNTVQEFRNHLERAVDVISKNPKIGTPYDAVVRKWVQNYYIHLYVAYRQSIRILQISYERMNWQNYYQNR